MNNWAASMLPADRLSRLQSEGKEGKMQGVISCGMHLWDKYTFYEANWFTSSLVMFYAFIQYLKNLEIPCINKKHHFLLDRGVWNRLVAFLLI